MANKKVIDRFQSGGFTDNQLSLRQRAHCELFAWFDNLLMQNINGFDIQYDNASATRIVLDQPI